MARLVGCDYESIRAASEILRQGGLVAFPTETVYGLGGNAYDDSVIEKIYAIKNRPSQNPLISHYANVDDVWKDVVPTRTAMVLAHVFWPGPMTLVLNKQKDSRISNVACASLPTAAVRVPSNTIANQLIKFCEAPIVAPSANKSTRLSATTADMVMQDFAQDDLIVINGKPCDVGIESTIIDARDDHSVKILRHGIITEDNISEVCELDCNNDKKQDKPIAPGMMFKHYSPKKHSVVINSYVCNADDAYLDFGTPHDVSCKYYMNLSQDGDLYEAAANLFFMLYELDETDCNRIVVAPIPQIGVGIAINDKLARAGGFMNSQLNGNTDFS